MGAIANAAHNEGQNRVLGIIPVGLCAREISGETVGEQIQTKDMHERKRLMAENSDGFVALPGGFGTMEELFEVITWQQLGYHKKPIGVLNVNGYFDSLLTFLDEARERFRQRRSEEYRLERRRRGEVDREDARTQRREG